MFWMIHEAKMQQSFLDIFFSQQTLLWKTITCFAEKFLTSTVQEFSSIPNGLQTYKHPAAPSTASLIRWKSSCRCYCCFISSPRKPTLTASRPNTMFIRRIKQLLRSPLKSSVGSLALNQRADIIQPPAPHAPHRNSTWSQLQSDLDSKQMRCPGLPPDLVAHLLKGLLTPSTKYTFVLEENFSECQPERFALIYSLCVTRYIMHFGFVLACFPSTFLEVFFHGKWNAKHSI